MKLSSGVASYTLLLQQHTSSCIIYLLLYTSKYFVTDCCTGHLTLSIYTSVNPSYLMNVCEGKSEDKSEAKVMAGNANRAL